MSGFIGKIGGKYPQTVPSRFIPEYVTKTTTSTGTTPTANSERNAFSSVDHINQAGAKTQVKQWTIAGSNKPVPISYGTNRQGALIALCEQMADGGLLILGVLSHGEIGGATAFQIDDKPPHSGCVFTVHTGGTTQAPDPTLVSYFAGLGQTYSDALNGIAYFVASIPAVALAGLTNFPRITCIVSGIKVFDPRSNTLVTTNNPSLIAADFITNTIYGKGALVDWNSVGVAADFNDMLVGVDPYKEKHRTLDLVISDKGDVEVFLEALRTYTGCRFDERGNTIHFVPDWYRNPVASINSDSVLKWNYVRLDGYDGVPTEVHVKYTSKRAKPYDKDPAIARHPSLIDGAPLVVREVNLPGITRYSQALREATYQLNTLQLSNLRIGAYVGDEAVAWQIGDLHTITIERLNIANKQCVLDRIEIADIPGRFNAHWSEYDPAMHSTAVIPFASTNDSGQLDCNSIPPITGLTLTQQSEYVGNVCKQKLVAAWSSQYFPCFAGYDVILFKQFGDSLVVVDKGLTGFGEFVYVGAQIGATYSIYIKTKSSNPALPYGATVSASATITTLPCSPKAPSEITVDGEYQTKVILTNGNLQTYVQQVRIIEIENPGSPVTDTELWFAYSPTATFNQATLVKTAAGFASAFTWWRGSYVAADNTGTYQEAATIAVGSVEYVPSGFNSTDYASPGSNPTGAYPNAYNYTGANGDWKCPSKVWVRFKDGAQVSPPLEVSLSQAGSVLAVHNAPFAYQLRGYYTFDGALKTATTQIERQYTTANSVPYDSFNALNETVDYGFDVNHRIYAQHLDENGDASPGYVAWQSWRIEAQL